MIEVKDLRIEDMGDGWTRAVANIDFQGMKSPYAENSMWFSTQTENKEMLSDDSYDAFFLVPLYLAMYHKQDLHICGKVSKRLYKNIMTYVQTILCEFSDKLSRINIVVDGYTDPGCGGGIIGTGISCGVDSLSTIYDHFVKEDDKDYKINGLFIFNCGTHGDYENSKTKDLYEKRYELNKGAADEMGLPVYQVNSNLHAFTHKIGEQKVGYFAIWSCALALEKAIKMYYASSSNEYEEIKFFGSHMKDFDMAEFCESYLVPLIRTERMEFVVDGCQYRRTEKTVNISNWSIAQKHLNVCINSEDGSNCSRCPKCMRTLIPLEAMGELVEFSDVFDLDIYRKHAFYHKCYFVSNTKKLGFAEDIVGFCSAHGSKMPNRVFACLYLFIYKCLRKLKNLIKKHS